MVRLKGLFMHYIATCLLSARFVNREGKWDRSYRITTGSCRVPVPRLLVCLLRMNPAPLQMVFRHQSAQRRTAFRNYPPEALSEFIDMFVPLRNQRTTTPANEFRDINLGE